MEVYWAVAVERRLDAAEHKALAMVGEECGRRGYHLLTLPFNRIDVVRNRLAQAFYAKTSDPDDVLVMLDQDHVHPANVVERLVRLNKPIAASLCFRRVNPWAVSPPDALLWNLDANKKWQLVREWERGAVVDFDMAGWGAIAIRRKVFEAINTFLPWPWFRYHYRDRVDEFPSEDFHFGVAAHGAGIKFTVDTSLESPHLSVFVVNQAVFDGWPWERWDAEAEQRKREEQADGYAIP